MLSGHQQHVQVNVRVFVTRKTDETDFACFLRFQHRFHRAIFGEDAVGIFEADDFVVLEQVEVIGLQPLQRLVNLAGCFLAGAAIELGHQENFVAVSTLERLSHAHFTGAVVVVPGIVHEVDAAIDGSVDEANGVLLGKRLLPKVEATHADHGNMHPGLPQCAVGNITAGFDSRHLPLLSARRNGTQHHSRDRLHKSSSFHICLAALG